jgi:hypothetical protein
MICPNLISTVICLCAAQPSAAQPTASELLQRLPSALPAPNRLAKPQVIQTDRPALVQLNGPQLLIKAFRNIRPYRKSDRWTARGMNLSGTVVTRFQATRITGTASLLPSHALMRSQQQSWQLQIDREDKHAWNLTDFNDNVNLYVCDIFLCDEQILGNLN